MTEPSCRPLPPSLTASTRSRRRRGWIAATLLATTVLLATQPMDAQTGDPTGADAASELPYFETVDVQVVNVDAFVTDKDGEPISDLTRDDFELLEDGKPVAITNFYAIDRGRLRRVGETAEILTGSAAPAAAQVSEDLRLRVVVFIDNLNIHPLSRRKGLVAIRSFLRRYVTPQDRVMVVSFNKSLSVRQPFTADLTAVNDALRDIEEEPGLRVEAERRRQSLLAEIFDYSDQQSRWSIANVYIESAFFDGNQTLDALQEVVDSLAGLPGRKALLYVSDGVQMRSGEDIFVALDERAGDSGAETLAALRYDLSRRFQAIAAQANSRRVIFYTIDTAGLRTASKADVASYQVGRSSSVDSTYVAGLQDPLFLLANETGGQAIVNTNNLGPMLERVGQDFTALYSLGYSPPHAGDGRYRSIEVRVRRPGAKVRHRMGYRDEPIERRMEQQTQATLNFGVEDNRLGIDLRFGPPQLGSGATYTVPLLVLIPMADLVFLPIAGGERVHSSLQLYVAVGDRDGGASAVQAVPVSIELPAASLEHAQANLYQLQHSLLMRSGRQLVAIGLRDRLGGAESFIVRGLNVGS